MSSAMRTLTGMVVALNVVLSAAVYAGRRERERLGRSIDSLTQSVATSRIERRALISTLADFPYRGSLLEGLDAETGRQFVVPIDPARTQIVYLLSATCRACVVNLAFLDSLFNKNRGAIVLGFSRTEGVEDLSGYARRNHIAFPVLSRPAGYADRLLPRFSVPLTAVLQRGHLVALLRGTLRVEDKADIRAMIAEENTRTVGELAHPVARPSDSTCVTPNDREDRPCRTSP